MSSAIVKIPGRQVQGLGLVALAAPGLGLVALAAPGPGLVELAAPGPGLVELGPELALACV